ncbi:MULTISPECIES: crotonase/enoyl-CoA hydratase family protein [unclassified Modestobacter]|uniref:crotonase/enoyl-CoA hydratase family protein n=1 Tax=unclassified Modestobacter TaxID=2643866 RepID=UPI0022AB2E1F|nr:MULTISPECIES: crotonase/enoyl-CoA hydratase family protein [unclassified Modestobacter]MCZ2824263.1 crotonase/enoyl-CoA hydratase family protein [Modestobacter sp. VKM Ac-2981]MCZ2854209.1 crotonase/enoyl-CoA hydratase family protein [Modestobacter sp. VKM Ac-2982]
MTAPVLTEVTDGVGVLTLNRPEAKNAVDLATTEALAAAIDEFDARDDVAVLVLTGAGGTFCAGMDLKAFARGERPRIEGRGFAGLTEAPPAKPLIAAVEGWALAGGCELALSADLVVAARDARFGIPEVKRGLFAAGGGVLRLAKALPYQRAMEMALTGDPMPAEEAHRFGLVNTLTEPGGALAGARELAARIVVNGPLGVRASKQLIAGSVGWTDRAALDAQRELADRVFGSADALEGARAFAEKRPPVWRGE